MESEQSEDDEELGTENVRPWLLHGRYDDCRHHYYYDYYYFIRGPCGGMAFEPIK